METSPRGQRRPKAGIGMGKGRPGGRRLGRNTGGCRTGQGPGKGKGGGRGLGKNRAG